MERGSDKHSPRIDEEQKREIAGMTQGGPSSPRIEEHRMTEDPGGLQPALDRVVNLDDVETRSAIARALDTTVWPADRRALLENAEQHHAPEAVLILLNRLPDGTFENVQAVWERLGGKTEQRA